MEFDLSSAEHCRSYCPKNVKKHYKWILNVNAKWTRALDRIRINRFENFKLYYPYKKYVYNGVSLHSVNSTGLLLTMNKSGKVIISRNLFDPISVSYFFAGSNSGKHGLISFCIWYCTFGQCWYYHGHSFNTLTPSCHYNIFCFLYQPLTALHHNGSQCDRPVIDECFELRFFWHWDNGGSLETWQHDGMVQQGVWKCLLEHEPAGLHVPLEPAQVCCEGLVSSECWPSWKSSSFLTSAMSRWSAFSSWWGTAFFAGVPFSASNLPKKAV